MFILMPMLCFVGLSFWERTQVWPNRSYPSRNFPGNYLLRRTCDALFFVSPTSTPGCIVWFSVYPNGTGKQRKSSRSEMEKAYRGRKVGAKGRFLLGAAETAVGDARATSKGWIRGWVAAVARVQKGVPIDLSNGHKTRTHITPLADFNCRPLSVESAIGGRFCLGPP